MLADKELRTFVPTTHPREAKLFYRDTLGLTFLSEDSFATEFDANGTLLRVTAVKDLTPQPFTILGWNVNHIESLIKALKTKGVQFEIYGFLEQDSLGIWTAPGGTKVAWFKDVDGNILSLSES